jgi:hypothetical protein
MDLLEIHSITPTLTPRFRGANLANNFQACRSFTKNPYQVHALCAINQRRSLSDPDLEKIIWKDLPTAPAKPLFCCWRRHGFGPLFRLIF